MLRPRADVPTAFAVALTTLLLARVAAAHIALDAPKARYAELKEGPCGRGAGDARTANVTTFRSGQTITVKWRETIGHPGHYRISFDPTGTRAFVDPKSFTDVSSAPSVLADGIVDKTGTGSYSQAIKLPDVECTTCTLQLIQVMTDKTPFGDGNDLYYQCADLVLSKGAVEAPPDDVDGGATQASPATTTTPADGCATTTRVAGSAQPPALLALAIALGVLRRRNRHSGNSAR